MPEISASERIADVVLVRPDAHGDERGRFVETYRREWFPAGREMVQANRSEKRQGSLVGLHYHRFQADYWYALRGSARVVLHDLREGSPTEAATEVFDLHGDEERGVYIPPGVAHGFAALSDLLLCYLVDRYYDPDDELGLAWDDPSVGAAWGVEDPVLSARDQANPGRGDLPEGLRPRWGA
jgi:dTDP-4-dehydrorhamnose 3,5-epimerase